MEQSENFDPLDDHRDDELWNALEEVTIKNLVENLEGQLDYELLERGENLSVGQVAEMDTINTLLGEESGIFYGMAASQKLLH